MSPFTTLRRLRDHPLVRATMGVAGLTLVVKISSLVKDMFVASRFGFSEEMDAFTLALGLVGFFVSLLAGNLNSAFIPVYSRLGSQANPATARALLQAVMRRLPFALAILALLLALGLPWSLPLIAPRWQPEGLQRLQTLTLILLPWLPVAGAAMLTAAALNGEHRFGAPAIIPMLTPLTILACLTLTGSSGGATLAIAVALGGALELVALLTVLRALGTPAGSPDRRAVTLALSDVGRQYLPALGAGLLMNSTNLVDMTIASLLPVGAVSALGYASKIPAVVITLSAGALSTTALPAFSRLAATEDWRGLRRLVTQGVALALVCGALATLVLGVLSPWLVRLLYQRGAFGPDEVAQVAEIQLLYLLQLPFFLGGILVVRLISALGRNQILFWGTILSAALNLGLDLAFLPRLGARGIALSTSCVYLVSFCFLSFWGHRLLRAREVGRIAL